eukprot:TRINITY_DN21873_c0_g1_i1.p1 TRINITY_DN21873_c0_g1~~TRINITY_DN21873_c0_g1_i1.p1  ORF type:complete len:111 (-),score=20.92 TRINITY_DN21873_c0_g1_i1:223-525(-)
MVDKTDALPKCGRNAHVWWRETTKAKVRGNDEQKHSFVVKGASANFACFISGRSKTSVAANPNNEMIVTNELHRLAWRTVFNRVSVYSNTSFDPLARAVR